MSEESNKPFVVTDRRKFTLDGELRPDAERPQERAEEAAKPVAIAAEPRRDDAQPGSEARADEGSAEGDSGAEPDGLGPELPAPTTEQMDQSRRAYEQTAERLETAIRATNPGMEHPPAMNFEQLVQSVYLTAIMQLGGGTAEGEQPRVDLLGARSSIDMMGVLAEKTKGNLDDKEQRYVDSALFELRMAFLEMTQALARSAQARAGQGSPGAGGAAGGPGGLGSFGGGTPTLVR